MEMRFIDFDRIRWKRRIDNVRRCSLQWKYWIIKDYSRDWRLDGEIIKDNWGIKLDESNWMRGAHNIRGKLDSYSDRCSITRVESIEY